MLNNAHHRRYNRERGDNGLFIAQYMSPKFSNNGFLFVGLTTFGLLSKEGTILCIIIGDVNNLSPIVLSSLSLSPSGIQRVTEKEKLSRIKFHSFRESVKKFS